MNLPRIKALLGKEIKQALRDKRMRMIIFVSPLIQLFLFGYAVNTDVREISTIVCDQSNTSISRGLTDAFQASGYFRIVKRAHDPREAEPLIDKGKAQVILVIPEDFTRALRRGHPADLQMIVEGTDSIVASNAVSYGNMIIAGHLQKFAQPPPTINTSVVMISCPMLDTGAADAFLIKPGIARAAAPTPAALRKSRRLRSRKPFLSFNTILSLLCFY